MVAGLAFLSKKSFNPKNLSNQKTVWEAREAKKQEDRRIHERSQQLQREQEELELARVRHGDTGGDRASLGFMYAPPPGMQDVKEKSGPGTSTALINCSANSAALLHERQPGDDDAAAAFRAMLASGSANTDKQQQPDEQDESLLRFSNNAGAALQGTSVERVLFSEKDGRSALEKAVGRRNNNNGGATLEEQLARFPQLKHAPMAKGLTKQSSSANVSVNFKPLGTQLRNVQCLSCGIWGHSRGDRECAKSGWDPFASHARGEVSAPSPLNTTAVVDPASRKGASLLTRGKHETITKTTARESGERLAKDEIRRAPSHSSSSSSSSSDDEDSYQRRKRRKRERKRERKRRKRHEHGHGEEKKRRRGDDDSDREEVRRYHKKTERRKKRRRRDSDSSD